MNTKLYAKSEDGLIHLVSSLNCEVTLCGNVFEGTCMKGESQEHAWVDCPPTHITCPECIREILNCRNVKIKG